MLTWRMGQAAAQNLDVTWLSLVGGRSTCPNCDKTLTWHQLVPVFSWCVQRGKCASCQTSISPRYPLIELSCAVLTLAVIWQFGPTAQGIYYVVFGWMLLAMVVIDIEHHLLLDQLTLPLMWLGLLINTQALITPLNEAVWGAALGYLLLWTLYHVFLFLTGKEGMGYGDFKLLAALGAWFGWSALPQIILMASLSSLFITLGLWLLRRVSLQAPIPFGPYLALGGLSMVFIPA
jgi:leader peptidase (prepilin peptidase)/N-methyltransferase